MTDKRLGPYKAEEIFYSAECFRDAANVLEQKVFPPVNSSEKSMDFLEQMQFVRSTLLIPAVVIQAFTLELYLKCLKAIETKHHLKSHDLKELFDDLLEADRLQLTKYAAEFDARIPYPPEFVKEMGPKEPFDIHRILTVSAQGFENFRYVYGKKPTQFIAASVEDGARRLILQKTGWKCLMD